MATTTMTTMTTTADRRRHRAPSPAPSAGERSSPRHRTGAAPYAKRPRGARLRRSLLIVGLTVAGAAAVGGAARGFVGGTASGGGSAPVLTPAPLTALARPADDLAPGLEVPATVTIENPYNRPVVVQALTGGGAELAGGDPACDPAVVTFTAAVDPLAPGSTVPAGAHATVTGLVTMSPAAAPACQGASFRVPVVVTVRLS